MLKYEFEDRAIKVSDEEFDSFINPMYMNSDVDKDEFCRLWCKMNFKRVERFKEEQRKNKEYCEAVDMMPYVTSKVWDKETTNDIPAKMRKAIEVYLDIKIEDTNPIEMWVIARDINRKIYFRR